jgi:hypothetical protein
MNAWILYYKGTGVQIPVQNSSIDIIILEAEGSIEKGLSMGVSRKIQRKQIKEDLDEMEAFLVKTFVKEWDANDLKRLLGEIEYKKFVTKWSINVIAGLKLNVFKNDEMNGHQFIR